MKQHEWKFHISIYTVSIPRNRNPFEAEIELLFSDVPPKNQNKRWQTTTGPTSWPLVVTMWPLHREKCQAEISSSDFCGFKGWRTSVQTWSSWSLSHHIRTRTENNDEKHVRRTNWHRSTVPWDSLRQLGLSCSGVGVEHSITRCSNWPISIDQSSSCFEIVETNSWCFNCPKMVPPFFDS